MLFSLQSTLNAENGVQPTAKLLSHLRQDYIVETFVFVETLRAISADLDCLVEGARSASSCFDQFALTVIHIEELKAQQCRSLYLYASIS